MKRILMLVTAILAAGCGLEMETDADGLGTAKQPILLPGGSTTTGTSYQESPTQLIANGGFNKYVAGWDLVGNAKIIGNAGSAGTDGLMFNYGSWGTPGAARQRVSLPWSATSAKVAFQARVMGSEYRAYRQVFRVRITDNYGNTLKTLLELTPATSTLTTGWHSFGPFEIADLKGRDVKLDFGLAVASENVLDWRVDNASLLIWQ